MSLPRRPRGCACGQSTSNSVFNASSSAVIQEKSVQVAEALVRIVDDHLGDRNAMQDLEASLTRLARAWTVPLRDFVDHFELVRDMLAEAPRLPSVLLEAWNTAGAAACTGDFGVASACAGRRRLACLRRRGARRRPLPAPDPGSSRRPQRPWRQPPR